MLAKNARTTRSFRMSALSFRFSRASSLLQGVSGGGTVAGVHRWPLDRSPRNPETFQRFVRVFVCAQGEGIEPATAQVEQLVTQHIANGTQLTLVTITVTQQAGVGVVAPVGEGRKVQGDDLKCCTSSPISSASSSASSHTPKPPSRALRAWPCSRHRASGTIRSSQLEMPSKLASWAASARFRRRLRCS